MAAPSFIKLYCGHTLGVRPPSTTRSTSCAWPRPRRPSRSPSVSARGRHRSSRHGCATTRMPGPGCRSPVDSCAATGSPGSRSPGSCITAGCPGTGGRSGCDSSARAASAWSPAMCPGSTTSSSGARRGSTATATSPRSWTCAAPAAWRSCSASDAGSTPRSATVASPTGCSGRRSPTALTIPLIWSWCGNGSASSATRSRGGAHRRTCWRSSWRTSSTTSRITC